jgi:hypothetical protein
LAVQPFISPRKFESTVDTLRCHFCEFHHNRFGLSATDQQAVLQTLLKALPLLENRKNVIADQEGN